MSLFIIDLESTAPSREEQALLRHPNTAGVLLFTRNFTSRAQLKFLINDIKTINAHLLLMIDQEGGNVQRLQRQGFRSLPALRGLGELYDRHPEVALEQARHWAKTMAADLLALGIHLSLAPVLDLHVSGNPIIAELDRAFHADPLVVKALAQAYIEGMRPMPAVGKHFPGHGSSTADSHLSQSFCALALEELQTKDLYPFSQLIKQGDLPALMLSHVIYPQVDAHYSAGYSSLWRDYLRQKLNFKGLTMSDCLGMAGADIGDLFTRAKTAAHFCDLIIVANQSRATLKSLLQASYQRDVQSAARFETFLTLCLAAVPALEPVKQEHRMKENSVFSAHSSFNNTKGV